MAKKNPKEKSDRKVVEKKCFYRMLAYQPLSVEIDAQTFLGLSIQNTKCDISIRNAHIEHALKLQSGGSSLAIEFQADLHLDLLIAARQGLSLLEDFLSAIALVNGSIFQSTEPVQIVRLLEGNEVEFLMVKQLPLKHWSKPITPQTVKIASHILAHWDGLASGHRLRRAALQYREAIGNLDDIIAFQEAYIGLESMEPPLAQANGLLPGTEEVKGSCEKCGHHFTRKKTTLVGVRAFVLGSLNSDLADPGRKADWKLINQLRNDLMHSLVDSEKLGDRPNNALISVMHYLHAAICSASHASSLSAEEYELVRGGPVYVFHGYHIARAWVPLGEWEGSLKCTEFKWVPHAKFGFVPETLIDFEGLEEFKVRVGILSDSFSYATMKSIKSIDIEHD